MDERQRFTGRNEDQALERAERVLGVARTGLSWTIVSQERGFLGLGGSVTIEVVVPAPSLAPSSPPPPTAASPRAPAPEPATGEGRGRDRGRGRGRDRGRDRPRAERPPAPRLDEPEEEDGPVDEALLATRIERAGEVTRGLLEAMGWTAAITVERQGHSRILVKLDEGASDLAADGRDLVDAIQFLLNKIVNRFPPRYRIVVDVAGMMERLDAELARRAQAWCERVLETGEELWVEEELNPRDRRIVHLEVRKHAGLDSRSDGHGRDRRLCIFRI